VASFSRCLRHNFLYDSEYCLCERLSRMLVLRCQVICAVRPKWPISAPTSACLCSTHPFKRPLPYVTVSADTSPLTYSNNRPFPEMTRPPPLTFVSSVNTKRKDGSQFGQISFEFAHPALNSMDSRSSSSVSYNSTSPGSPAISPTNVHSASRRRAPAVQNNAKDVFTLPPPPTRSQKIINIRPQGKQKQPINVEGHVAKGPATKCAANTSNKKKQPSTTSTAERKIACKTVHTLIGRH